MEWAWSEHGVSIEWPWGEQVCMSKFGSASYQHELTSNSLLSDIKYFNLFRSHDLSVQMCSYDVLSL